MSFSSLPFLSFPFPLLFPSLSLSLSHSLDSTAAPQSLYPPSLPLPLSLDAVLLPQMEADGFFYVTFLSLLYLHPLPLLTLAPQRYTHTHTHSTHTHFNTHTHVLVVLLLSVARFSSPSSLLFLSVLHPFRAVPFNASQRSLSLLPLKAAHDPHSLYQHRSRVRQRAFASFSPSVICGTACTHDSAPPALPPALSLPTHSCHWRSRLA